MPEKQRVRLEFPLGGRNDRLAYQKQQPFTTVSARNVWPDPAGDRKRGGSRPGVERVTVYDFGASIIGLGQVSYVPTASSRIRTSLLAITADTPAQVFRIDPDDTDFAVLGATSSTFISGSELISMQERSQKLYIANHSIVQSESSGTYVPQIYDPVANTVSNWTATDGTIPYGCNCIALFRDRMVLAGGTTDPYGVFFSRQGDPLDWDYSETDEGAAVNLSLTSAGQMPDTVTAMAAHADNCLILGCPTSLWMLVGDPGPGGGGQLVNLSDSIGVVDRHAWCKTPDGLFVFLSADGLYAIPAGCGVSGNPVSLSREKLPTELLNIERASTSSGKIVSLAYDVRWRGVHIFVSDRTSDNDDTGNVHWFFDWESKAFWEVQFREARCDPWNALAWKNRASNESVVVTGCRDGCCRRYLSTATVDDDGESTEQKFDSHVVIGPIVESAEMTHDVRLDELDITLSRDSEQVDWQVFSGDSAEDALAKVTDEQPDHTGRAVAGCNNRFYPRVRGTALLLRISSTAYWAFESAVATVAKLGRTRP